MAEQEVDELQFQLAQPVELLAPERQSVRALRLAAEEPVLHLVDGDDLDNAPVGEVQQSGHRVGVLDRPPAHQRADESWSKVRVRELAEVRAFEVRPMLAAVLEEEEDDEAEGDERQDSAEHDRRAAAAARGRALGVGLVRELLLLGEDRGDARPFAPRRLRHRLRREEHADLDEGRRRKVVDGEYDDAVRADADVSPQRTVGPGADLVTAHAARRRHRRPHMVGRDLPTVADQLPIQLGGVVPPFRGAADAVLDAEPRRRVGQTEAQLDPHPVAFVGDEVRARLSGGARGRRLVRTFRAAGADDLDALAVLLVELPVDEAEVAAERERAPLLDEQRPVRPDARTDVDVGDRVALGEGGRRGEERRRHGEHSRENQHGGEGRARVRSDCVRAPVPRLAARALDPLTARSLAPAHRSSLASIVTARTLPSPRHTGPRAPTSPTSPSRTSSAASGSAATSPSRTDDVAACVSPGAPVRDGAAPRRRDGAPPRRQDRALRPLLRRRAKESRARAVC